MADRDAHQNLVSVPFGLLGQATCQIDLVVLQPTPFCNIDCSYCYLPGRSDHGVMSEETVRAIFSDVAAVDPRTRTLDVVWHAGEPMVRPPDWYRRMFAIISETAGGRISVQHRMQTNGTLLNEEWCRLIGEWNVRIGLSVDGPAEINDKLRVTRDGRGTFDKIAAGIKLLRANGIEFNVISVLTLDSLNQAEALFRFYDAIGVDDIGFNCEEVRDVHTTSSMQVTDIAARYSRFLEEFCDLCEARQKNWRIRDIAEISARLVAGSGLSPPSLLVRPGCILSFDHKGNVSTFSPELLTTRHPAHGDFFLGNINHGRLRDMLGGEKLAGLQREIALGVERCRRTCDYFALCGGGDPSSKLSETNEMSSTETLFCRLKIKAVTDTILVRMKRDLADSALEHS